MQLNLLAEAAEGTPTLDWGSILNAVVQWMTTTGIRLVISIIILIISFKIINAVTKRIYRRIHEKHMDETLARVGSQTLRVLLKIVVLACIVGYIGIETASISAVIASIGVGISLAVQGTLSNFAGGVIIIVMRPFKIGDYITSNGESGTVEDIKLFYTHIVTPDNKAVVIPNGQLANNVIVNASAKDSRRVEIITSVAYGSDIAKVKDVLKAVCAENELVYTDPAPFVELSNMGNSSIDFTTRVWCNNSDYWTVYFALLTRISSAMDENGIEIPFEQLDVHLKKLPEPEPVANCSVAIDVSSGETPVKVIVNTDDENKDKTDAKDD